MTDAVTDHGPAPAPEAEAAAVTVVLPGGGEALRPADPVAPPEVTPAPAIPPPPPTRRGPYED